ncbi:MAG: indole-3-glycerol phosphate synthase TrpC [Planctomycetes bacterium]|nr:indole-3-glycerol phosphate synthase TrpC [Planctomycetota bacterium]
MILDEIHEHKLIEVAERKEQLPLDELEKRLPDAPPVRDFAKALATEDMGLVAEVKKASPSAGVIREDFDPVAIARAYADAGAAAISVLTDEKYFQGSLSFLEAIRAEVAIPLLRKDFIIDPYQVVEARVAEADAILLIVHMLDDGTLKSLLDQAHGLGMKCLVESHSEEELDRAIASGAQILGINNRDLQTFQVDVQTAIGLAPSVPGDRIIVGESGIKTADDVRRLAEAGVSAILVGESLIRSNDIPRKIRELMGW